MNKFNINIENLPKIRKEQVIILGNFDGVHIIHQKIINEALLIANKLNFEITIITFTPHPLEVLKENSFLKITSNNLKKKYFESLNINNYIELKFDKNLEKMNHNEFIEKLTGSINIKSVFVGFDFKYGYKGIGNVETLNNYDFDVNIIDKELYLQENIKIGSSLIREFITDGYIEKANELLNKKFELQGEVIHGNKLGRKINFPTANIFIEDNQIIPKNGVYKTIVTVENIDYIGLTNVGLRPTLNNGTTKIHVETFIIDFNNEIYSKIINIKFVKRIRDEIKFSSLIELKNQINLDLNEI